MRKFDKTKDEKLKLIKSLLSGSLTFESLKPPKCYWVTKKDTGLYKVDMYHDRKDIQLLNEEQFEAWKATLRSCDRIFMIIEHPSAPEDDPIVDDPIVSEPGAQQETEQAADEPIHIPTIRPVESPVNASESYYEAQASSPSSLVALGPAPVVAMEPYEVRRERRVRFADSFDELRRDSFLI